MQIEIKARTVSERVRCERDQRAGTPRAQEQTNRRRDERFSVSGSVVRVSRKPFRVSGADLDVRNVLFGFLPSLVSNRRAVSNLSKGGLAFESHSAVSAGVRVQMQLLVPGRAKPLTITGETRWCTRRLSRLYDVGVQFDPFSDRSGMNAPEVLQALRDFEIRAA